MGAASVRGRINDTNINMEDIDWFERYKERVIESRRVVIPYFS